MPLEIIRNDITKLKVDAIVNAANRSLLGGGGVDGAIHRAAGPSLLTECRTLGGCEVGKAKVTKGYNLPANHVIHTVGPIWHGGTENEETLLRSCYQSSLCMAKELGLESIAFPLISAGAFGYPKDQALKIAVETIAGFLLECDMKVYLVVFDKAAFGLSQKLFVSISQYIDDNYVAEHSGRNRCRNIYEEDQQLYTQELEHVESICKSISAECDRSLTDVLSELDDTFSERLLRLIDQKGYSDVVAYKRANIDRKLFSKIRSDKNYKPSKATILAFALALELSLDETKDFLLTAGFALSRSNRFDIIIEYFIVNQIYNIHEVNEALFAFDQALLGVS
jgi:O-acetyl-ADP-ribose deacetylase (regulator of RNase III)